LQEAISTMQELQSSYASEVREQTINRGIVIGNESGKGKKFVLSARTILSSLLQTSTLMATMVVVFVF